MTTIQKNQAVPRKNLISQAEKTRQHQLLYDTTIASYEAATSVEPDAKQAKRLAAVEKFKQQIKQKGA